MAFQRITAAVLVLAFVAGGCAGRHGHGGRVAAEYPPEYRAQYGYTRFAGDYQLFARQEPADRPDAEPSGSGWRLGTWHLDKGERLGFRQADGGLVAVAGDHETPLPPGRYCWHARAGTEPIDVGQTVLAVATVGIVTAVAVLWSQNMR
jgi:hypothetical protein